MAAFSQQTSHQSPFWKAVSFSNTLENEGLLERATLQAPKAVFSAKPGNNRGYGFRNDAELADVIEFNRDAVDVITDDDGQIPFIRELGLRHQVETGCNCLYGWQSLMASMVRQADGKGYVKLRPFAARLL
tara:strand:- start:93 stop:485 length:393 start_codon:yes stop_codon:yes gene_type:complete